MFKILLNRWSIIERSNLTKEDMLTIREKKKDTYFSAKEAKERGIITNIIGFPMDISGTDK